MTQLNAWIAFVYWPVSMKAWPPGTVQVGEAAATGATASGKTSAPARARIESFLRAAGEMVLSVTPWYLAEARAAPCPLMATITGPRAVAHRGRPLGGPPKVGRRLLDRPSTGAYDPVRGRDVRGSGGPPPTGVTARAPSRAGRPRPQHRRDAGGRGRSRAHRGPGRRWQVPVGGRGAGACCRRRRDRPVGARQRVRTRLSVRRRPPAVRAPARRRGRPRAGRRGSRGCGRTDLRVRG